MPARVSKGFRNFACRFWGRRAWANVYCSQVSLPAIPRSDVGSSHVYLWTSLWAWWQPLLSKCLLRELKGEAHRRLIQPPRGAQAPALLLDIPSHTWTAVRKAKSREWLSEQSEKSQAWVLTWLCPRAPYFLVFIFVSKLQDILHACFPFGRSFYQIYMSHAGGQGSWCHMRPA